MRLQLYSLLFLAWLSSGRNLWAQENYINGAIAREWFTPHPWTCYYRIRTQADGPFMAFFMRFDPRPRRVGNTIPEGRGVIDGENVNCDFSAGLRNLESTTHLSLKDSIDCAIGSECTQDNGLTLHRTERSRFVITTDEDSSINSYAYGVSRQKLD